jgi:transposase
MTGSCSVADAISGVTPQRSERTQADGKDGCDLAVAGLAEPSQHPGLVVAASLTDATASGLPAQTLQPRPSSPDNQALDRTAPCLPILPTTPARRTHDYVRNGTASLFAAFETGSGSVIAQPYRQHRHQEFIRFLKLTGDAVPKDLDLHLVLDNYATHKTPEVQKWLLRHPRFQLHFTPASASWMNLVERWFAELTRRKLRRSAHRSVRELETDLRKWTNEWNKNPKPFMWTKTADDIFDTLAAYCERINDSGH